MSSVLRYVAFQAVWCTAVLGAGAGHVWLGVLALVPYLAWVLARGHGRARRASRWIVAGALGSGVDCGLAAAGLVRYPTAGPGWPTWLVPPFIVGLWIAYASLHESLAWLARRPALAVLLGALGGPLCFAAATRAGAVDHGGSRLATSAALALEYALATPILLRWCRRPEDRARVLG